MVMLMCSLAFGSESTLDDAVVYPMNIPDARLMVAKALQSGKKMSKPTKPDIKHADQKAMKKDELMIEKMHNAFNSEISKEGIPRQASYNSIDMKSLPPVRLAC